MLQLRTRPEVFESPYFVDTGKFPATQTRISGIEAYYRPHSLLVGTEYFFDKVKSPEKGNPSFNGGDVFISWLPTGEVRSITPAADSSIRSRLCDPSSAVDLEPGNWSVVSLTLTSTAAR
jgi:hypothetical protein